MLIPLLNLSLITDIRNVLTERPSYRCHLVTIILNANHLKLISFELILSEIIGQ
ncbi:MAG: hypothetical protein JWM09_6 [Francisellaceae bacterium]|nr:hypothetical protein [Francisellaceae bacterium]